MAISWVRGDHDRRQPLGLRIAPSSHLIRQLPYTVPGNGNPIPRKFPWSAIREFRNEGQPCQKIAKRQGRPPLVIVARDCVNLSAPPSRKQYFQREGSIAMDQLEVLPIEGE